MNDRGVDWLITFQKNITRDQYIQGGMLIWRHGMILFVPTTKMDSSSGIENDYNTSSTIHDRSLYENNKDEDHQQNDNFPNNNDNNYKNDRDDPNFDHGGWSDMNDWDDTNFDHGSETKRPMEDEDFDCTKYQHWDERPPECQGDRFPMPTDDDGTFEADTVTTGNPSETYPPSEWDNDDDDSYYTSASDDNIEEHIDNLVRINLLVGMEVPPTNMNNMTNVISRVITESLQTMTPLVDVFYFEDSPSLGQNRRRMTQQDGTLGSPSSATRTIHLLHLWTTMEDYYELPPPTVKLVWYAVRVDYAAFFGPESEPDLPEPMENPDRVGNVTWSCESHIDRSIRNGGLVEEIDDTIQDMLHEQEELMEESNTTKSETEMSNLLDDMRKNMDFQCMASVMKDGRQVQPHCITNWFMKRPRKVDSEPIKLDFGIREWCGVGLGGTTIVLALLLYGAASYYENQRQKRKEWSTTVLTEQGVTDILNVGWRYHHTTSMYDIPTKESQSGDQLFIQIFKRPKIRSDDDSILHGGVEQQEISDP